MSIFLLIIIISIIEFFGDSNFKHYARTNQLFYLFLGLLFYTAMIYFLVLALKKANVAYVNSSWDAVSALVETGLAILILHETLSNRIQYIGVVFIIIGIFALNYGPVPY